METGDLRKPHMNFLSLLAGLSIPSGRDQLL